jgi:hypothetical protein
LGHASLTPFPNIEGILFSKHPLHGITYWGEQKFENLDGKGLASLTIFAPSSIWASADKTLGSANINSEEGGR